MARILLHIGDRKTGTTSLQYVLDAWDRAGEAQRHGVLYPRAGRWSENQVNHVNLAHEVLGDRRFLVSNGSWADLGQEVAKSDAPLVIISSEGFESADPAAMRTAIERHLPGHEIEILSYLRPHMDRIRASYAQNAKTGKYHRSFETFAHKSARGRLGMPGRRLLAWRAEFGAVYQLRLYQRDSLLNGDIVQDILVDVAGLDRDLVTAMPQPEHDNPTPGAAVVEIIRTLTHTLPLNALPDADAHHRFMNMLEQSVLRRLRTEFSDLYPEDTPISFPPDVADLVHDLCLEDARAIDAAFFSDSDRQLEKALDASRANAHAAPRPMVLSEHDQRLHTAYAKATAAIMGRLLRQFPSE